ncbi:fatty acid synthase alpha subunit Lsd1, partial [Coemansia aciculifera]
MPERVVCVNHGSNSIEIAVSVELTDMVQALADSFSADSTESLSAIELHAAFIQHCVEFGSSEAALAVFGAFCQPYGTATSDIHVIVQAQGLDEAAARRVLKGYFSAWSIANNHSSSSPLRPAASTPALFATESAGLMAMFGGQRGTDSYLDEAEWLLDVYHPLLIDFVSRMSAFLHRESQDKRVSFVYSKGLDVFNWLTTASTMPDEQYLLSAPVCQPLFALTQLMHVMVLHKTLGISPGELVKRFKDEQSFFDVGERILGIHLLAGAFPQLQYPCHRVLSEPNSGTESRPMLSVQGITKPVLEKLIAKFNSRQPSPTEHAFLAVVNTVDKFTVASEISSAAKFVEFLRSESADPDKD